MELENGSLLILPRSPFASVLLAMPRSARAAEGGIVCHVLNRGNGRRRRFRQEGDYAGFLEALEIPRRGESLFSDRGQR